MQGALLVLDALPAFAARSVAVPIIVVHSCGVACSHMGKASAPQAPRKQATPRSAPLRGRTSKGSFITFGLVVGIGVAVALIVVAQSRGKKAEVKWGDFSLSIDTGGSLHPEQQQARQRSIEQSVEAKVREAPPPAVSTSPRSGVDLTGTWTSVDGSVTWSVASENGQLVYNEQRRSMPGWVTAVGYGPFDGHVWTATFQDLNRHSGAVRLTMVDDRTLSGVIEAYGRRFDLELEREVESSVTPQ